MLLGSIIKDYFFGWIVLVSIDFASDRESTAQGERKMNKYLKLMTNKTKMKCLGIITLAMVSSILASIWPVKLGELYTEISG